MSCRVAVNTVSQIYSKKLYRNEELKNMRTNQHPASGFTLIELLVVATILIVLTTIGAVSYRAATINSRNAKRKADLEIVRQAMMLYKQDTGYYTSTASAANTSSGAAFTSLLSIYSNYLTTGLDTLADPKTDTTYYYRSTCTQQNAAGNCVKVTLTDYLEPTSGNTPVLYSIVVP